MQKALNFTFDLAANLAALFFVGILICVLGSIFSRLLGFNLPGLDAYAGYFMAAATFLAMASTLCHGEHIRVTLLLNALKGKANFALEIFCHIFGMFFSGALAWFSLRLVINSYLFNDISTNLDATALWIPQIGMALGSFLLFIAFLNNFFGLIKNKQISYQKNETNPTFME